MAENEIKSGVGKTLYVFKRIAMSPFKEMSARGWDRFGGGYWKSPHGFIVWPLYLAASLALVAAAFFTLQIIARIAGLMQAGNPDDINKLLLALAGVIGAPLVVWRVLIAHRANHIAQENLYTTLLTKAVEQLGATREVKSSKDITDKEGEPKSDTSTNTAPNIEVRLGGIYALEKLARDYETLHWPIMEILCAYVRENAGPAKACADEVRAACTSMHFAEIFDLEDWKKRLNPPRIDIQTAMTVIGRRSESQIVLENAKRAEAQNVELFRLNLAGCHLAKIDLDGLNFEGANFDGTCLAGASVKYARLDRAQFIKAYLEGARLDGASLRHARLDDAHLERANLACAGLNCARLTGAHLEHALLFEARLICANLHRAHLRCARLDAARLQGASLSGSYPTCTSFAQAQLDAADFRGIRFNRTVSNPWKANFDGASIADALFDGVDLTETEDFPFDRIASCFGNELTILPGSVARPNNDRWIDVDVSLDQVAARDARWRTRRDKWIAEAALYKV